MLAVFRKPTAKGPRVRHDATTILFGLPGLRVGEVERDASGARVVHVVTADASAAACPQCGTFSTSIRQRRTTRPRDLPYGEQPLAVAWHKVQYACREQPCPRRAFSEAIAELPPGARVTGRLRRQVGVRVAQGILVSGAAQGLLSWPIAHAAWVAHAQERLTEPEPVSVLGIDETRRGRPRWGYDEVLGRWVKLERFETNFVDLGGCQGLLGQASGRTKATVVGWLDARGQDWKDQVGLVAMDPCATYRAAVQQALPQARIVAGHFHLVALANKAVTEVRRRVTLDTTGQRGTAPDPIWARRTRLLRGFERLGDRQFATLWNDLIDNDASGQILAAWIAKEELRRLLATAKTGGTRHDVAHRLFRFNTWCADSGVPELQRLAATIETWWKEVLGFLQTNVTNAGTEAVNRTVKSTARTVYGFRNLDNQRRRVRFACTRRQRR
jgi:transposase